MLQVLMYDIIVFENSAFVRPHVNDFKAEFSKIFTLKSVFEKMRFRWPFSPDTRVGTVVQAEEKKYPFSSKNGYLWTRPQTPWLTWNVYLNLTITHILETAWFCLTASTRRVLISGCLLLCIKRMEMDNCKSISILQWYYSNYSLNLVTLSMD